MNTIEKITVRENKALKLNNVLVRDVPESEVSDLNKIGYMMESYIKSKGNAILGPMINYSCAEVNESGQAKVILRLMVQLKNPIHKVEAPYIIEKQIRITNCLFARYSEKEGNLKFAYSKLQLHAFENEIKLKGDSYTVFVGSKDEKIVADVFMEVEKEALASDGL